MKPRTLLSIILPAVSLIFGCSNRLYQDDILFWGAKLNHKAWEEFNSEKRPKTIAEIHNFLANKITYLYEKKERWYSAKKTIGLGFGDCEDIAIVGSYFAERLGYPPKLLFLVDESNPKSMRCHAVTLLEERLEDKNLDNVKYGAIEKADLFNIIYDSIDNLITDMNRFYNVKYSYYLVLDLNEFNKNWRTTNKDMADVGILNKTPLNKVSSK